MIQDPNPSRLRNEEIARLVLPGSTVLDLGCGNGELLELLRDTRNVSGRGVDIQEAAIHACLEKGISVFQGNLDEGLKEYATGSYDYVILSETLQMVHDPVRLLREMVRVGRSVIVNFPNFGHIVNRLQLMFRGRMPVNRNLPLQWYETPNIHFCTRRDFVKLCRELGIQIRKTIDVTSGRRVSGTAANLFATECCFVLEGHLGGPIV